MRLTFATLATGLLVGSINAAPLLEIRDDLDFSNAHEIISRDDMSARSFGGRVVSWLCDLPHVDEICQK